MKDNQAKYPQLRFKGFTDSWKQRKLGDLADFNPKSVLPETFEYVDLESVVGTDIISHRLEHKDSAPSRAQRLAQKGDVFYQTVRPYQKNNCIFDKLDNDWVFSTGYAQLRPKKDSYFLLVLLQNNSFMRKVLGRCTGTSYPAINSKDLAQIKVSISDSIDEQKKIGNLFRNIDNTITLHQRKLAKLKELKQGYLQKLFPKNGSKFPQLRFAGFADAWEERKLVSMTNYKNGKGHEDKQSTIGKLELINLNSISISGGLKHSGKFIDEADDTLQKDDLVMILSDVGHGDLLGRVALIPEDDRFVLNQRVALLRPNATADPQFLFSYINAHQYYFKAQGAGMSQLNISKGSVENFISFVPIIEEQKKIGTFFKQLDNTITLHQRKLEKLQELKKGYLQKMFC